MARKFLFLSLVLALFSIQAAAQYPVVIQMPANTAMTEALTVAASKGGVVVASIYGIDTSQFLLSLPVMPDRFSDSNVRWSETNGRVKLPVRPQSTRQAKYLTMSQLPAPLWYQTQPSFQLVHLPGALSFSTGATMTVADLNSLVDCLHPDLQNHCTTGYDFVANKPSGETSIDDSSASYLDDSSASYLDQSSASYLDGSGASYLDDSSASYLDSLGVAYGHGTECASIIAAIAPNAGIMPLRVFDSNGLSDFFMISKALRWAVDHGAKVINMSFGSSTDSKVFRSAVAYALANGVTLTASAGNTNTSAPQYPAAYSGVITTAATDLLDVKAPFSNYGTTVDVDAPGVNIITAFPGNLYAVVSGTSFSAPIVAGTAALLRSQSSTGVESRIDAGAINIDLLNPLYAGKLGHGRIDILRSVHPQ